MSPRKKSITVSFAARDFLREQEIDPTLVQGARSAATTCLGLTEEEGCVLVSEAGMERIAAPLLAELEATGAEVAVYVVDRTKTSSKAFVQRLLAKLADVETSVLVCSITGIPQSFRRQMVPEPPSPRRHLHMAGVDERMMRQSMRADYEEVHRLGERLLSRLRPDSTIEVTTGLGTRLTVRCHPGHRWRNGSGLLHQPGWCNLPGGELYTAPASVDGVMIPDGGIWLPDGGDFGRPSRVKLTFEGGRLTETEGLEEDEPLSSLLDSEPEGRRVGQVGFGTNTAVLMPIGHLLQDLKMPGIHLTLGDPCPEDTGAGWSCSFEVPLLMRRSEVSIDGEPVMLNGRYVT